MADKTEKKQGAKFKKGQSGNPKGRPKGALNKTTLAAKSLLNGEAEALTRKCVEMALDGDSTAMRLCLDRIVPKVKESPVVIDLPEVSERKEFFKVTERILEAVTSGEITANQARSIIDLFNVHLGAVYQSKVADMSISEMIESM